MIDEQGHILTNAHVVEGAGKVEVSFGDDKTVDAKVVGRDESTDVALLKVDPDGVDLKPLTLGNCSKVQVGDAVVAIGNPFGLDRTVTTGIVSALQRQLEAPNGFSISNVIQTDAAINPGNSGGPLLDSRGRVIGINSQIATGGGGGGSVGIGFAVPINTVKKISDQLKEKGKVEHAFLGVTGVSITKSMSESLNLPTDKGVLVQRSTGPAKKAGIKRRRHPGADRRRGHRAGRRRDHEDRRQEGQVDGRRDRVVDSKKPGDQVTVELLRGKDQRTAKVTLGTRPASADSSLQQSPRPQPSRRHRSLSGHTHERRATLRQLYDWRMQRR